MKHHAITVQGEIRISSSVITDLNVLIIIKAVTTVITDKVVITETTTIRADTTVTTDRAVIIEIITTRADIIGITDSKVIITDLNKEDIKIVLNKAVTTEAVSKTEDRKAVILTVKADFRTEDRSRVTETELLNSFW